MNKKSVLATKWVSRNKMSNEIRLSVSGSRTLDDENEWLNLELPDLELPDVETISITPPDCFGFIR